jgi:TolB-like protein/DNA-binding winged helix-turn-helix (wHTH) protein
MDAFSPSDVLLFGAFRFDPRGGLYRRGDDGGERVVSIGSRALALLGVLTERPGDLVSKDAIMSAVWPGTVVEEGNLSVQISTLRRILDAGSNGQSCIQTVSGRGYRFVLPVARAEALPPGSAPRVDATSSSVADAAAVRSHVRSWPWWTAASAAASIALILAVTWQMGWLTQTAVPPRLSIVVLPFENLSGDPSDDYLADGITDDLTTDLARAENAFVIAHESAATYKAASIDIRRIGQELGIRYVLRGSMRRLGNVLRVDAQLVSAESGTDLWADRFDEQMEHLANVQEEIVQRLGDALGWRIVQIEAARSARERPDNPDVFDLLLRARWLHHQPYSSERLVQMTDLLERAVQLDPSSAAAKVFLAAILISQANETYQHVTADTLKRPIALLADAESLNPSCCNLLQVRAYLLWSLRRWPEALAAAQQNMDLQPNSADAAQMLAYLKLIFGAAEEAVPLLEKAIRLDPRGGMMFQRYRRIGQAMLVLGREDEAIPWFQRALAANPDAPVRYRALEYRMLAAAYVLTGREDDARQALTEATHLDRRNTFESTLLISANGVAAAQNQRYLDTLHLFSRFADPADEDADFGVAPDKRLRAAIYGYTPTTVPGTTTIKTGDLVTLLARSKPLVIDTTWNFSGNSIAGAVGLRKSGLGGDYTDAVQGRLRSKILEFTKGDRDSPIVVIGWNSARFDSYNLALRLVVLGCTHIYWYRGGREAWEVNGLPETPIDMAEW